MAADPTITAILMSKQKKLFAKDWLEIVALAEAGTPIEKISDAYGVHRSIIYRGLKKRRVNHRAAVARIEVEEAEKNRAANLIKIKDMKDVGYGASKFITATVIRILHEASKAAPTPIVGPIGAHLDTMKTLKIAQEAVKLGHEVQWRIMGMDRDNKDADAILPELPISEMTELEVEQMRLEQEVQDGMTPDELADAKAGRVADDMGDMGEEDVIDEDAED